MNPETGITKDSSVTYSSSWYHPGPKSVVSTHRHVVETPTTPTWSCRKEPRRRHHRPPRGTDPPRGCSLRPEVWTGTFTVLHFYLGREVGLKRREASYPTVLYLRLLGNVVGSGRNLFDHRLLFKPFFWPLPKMFMFTTRRRGRDSSCGLSRKVGHGAHGHPYEKPVCKGVCHVKLFTRKTNIR